VVCNHHLLIPGQHPLNAPCIDQLSLPCSPTGAVGPCEGIDHLVRLLDWTSRVPVRHHLLLLLAALVQPRTAAHTPQVGGVAPPVCVYGCAWVCMCVYGCI